MRLIVDRKQHEGPGSGQTLPGVEAIRLKLNYQCADRIIAASQMLLPEPSAFASHNGRDGEILIYKTERDVRGQADYALGRLVPAMLDQNPGWKLGDIDRSTILRHRSAIQSRGSTRISWLFVQTTLRPFSDDDHG